MKFILCHECEGVAVPHKETPEEISHCPCKQSGIMYTGKKNEVAFIGDVTILAIPDEIWETLLGDEAKHQAIIFNGYTIRQDASTVINANEASSDS